MPLTGPASYVPTTEAFLNHWRQVNAALPAASPLTLPGESLGFAQAVTESELDQLYTRLETDHRVVQRGVISVGLARQELAGQQRALLDLLNQFNDKVRGHLPGSKWERTLPAVPTLGDARSRFLDPMDDAADLWARINAGSVLGAGKTLTLREGQTAENFAQALVDIRLAYRALGRAEQDLRLARETRNDRQDVIRPVLKQYRVLMPTFFAPTHALVVTLPLLTPTGTRTPEPVKAAGTYDAASARAKVTFEASTDPDLDHYELRWSPGAEEYSTEDESVVGNLNPADPRVFLTDVGLDAPGATALYRVYVVLKTGNERGSETVTVTRPG